ncbi:MAG: D-alanine--D-alanine ligase [Bilifractor sp.]
MKIVVLAAGTSTERDVSIVSGTGICKALRRLGHQAILVDIFFGWKEADPETAFEGAYDTDAAADYIRSFNPQLEETKKTRKIFFGPNVIELCEKADIVFLALHGSNGEDGRVQAAFDLLGIRYTGTDYISSAISMDKSRTKQVFKASGVNTPAGITIFRGEKRKTAEEFGMQLPVIIKPCCGGSSVGITICRSNEEVQKGIACAFSLEQSAVIEEFIEGDEFTCCVIDGQAYPVVMITPKTGYYDFRNKYTAGATEELCPAPIPDTLTRSIQEEAVKAADAVGLIGYGRMDFLVRKSDQKVFCLEVNTLPGMTPTSLVPQEAAALGIDYDHLCQKLIDVSLKRYER